MMKAIQINTILFLGLIILGCNQNNAIVPDLTQVSDPEIWTVHNRVVSVGEEVHLDANQSDGFVKLNDLVFADGTIELDIKGKNDPGKSFVCLAFHGLNDSTYDVVYFRPFNFQNPERNTHSVQYIAHPEYTWRILRESHPDKYENKIDPVPDPDSWFHVKLVIKDHLLEAYVNNSETPSLSINQVSHRHKGWVGFWVGFNSEGWFKNLEITPAEL